MKTLTALEFVAEQIERMIRLKARQRDVAEIYRYGIRCIGAGTAKPFDPEWQRINTAISERWSARGLERVKKLAWGGMA